ncbi:hypothetical protein AA0313_2596 [Acetobacter indonesiensis NRIC 0313]|uniref:Uncharacterized protein n=1 Tax=Acetobacter indonesiensis TaxID=104101 RepID=A0A6N3T6C3_9PROT|nr:hypothetical protein [Acetobacter indonesiensis]GAN63350.1 hypothetical protein Abin_025_011 [Acetobacter indonesiensis]GBQ61090.1 hypothetical protein AA0313_2596 [Acetobacter indonesiensis NRIC 0313]GEN04871.1 hypothetical protein AIN02nite_28960 [Acetobacter indonesiensis]
MTALNPPMTEAEEDHLLTYRDQRLLFRRAEQVAFALLDLTNPKNDISYPQARHWLADELCMTLDRLGEIAGFNARRASHD